MQNRGIVSVLLLSLVTCGFYAIFVTVAMYVETNRELGMEKSFGLNLLLAFVTCGIWMIIMLYNTSQNHVTIASQKGITIADNTVLYLILAIFIQLAAIVLIQNQQNDLIDCQGKQDPNTF